MDTRFELKLIVRDSNGNATGKTRTFRTDSPERLATWFEQNVYRRKKKRTISLNDKERGKIQKQIHVSESIEELYVPIEEID